jgi:hypothetical protein
MAPTFTIDSKSFMARMDTAMEYRGDAVDCGSLI